MNRKVPILLVDDDLVDVKTVKRAFKHAEVSNPLYVANNGQEALDFLRHEGAFSDPSSAPRPGVILLDLNMPVMSGLEFLHELKADAAFKSIPVVVLTTSQHESDRVQSYDLSVAGYILKPVDFQKFIEVARTIDSYWRLCELAA